MLIVGCCFLTPDKLVRIAFPYIKRKGINTVVFGFLLSKSNIRGLLWISAWVVSLINLTFWSQTFITLYSYNNNPYSASVIQLDCFYINNNTLVTEETPQEDIVCFAINSNLGGAMGHITGVLALAWIVVAIVTRILLKVHYKIITCIKNNNSCCIKLTHYICFLFIIIEILRIILFISIILKLTFYFKYDQQWLYHVLTPEFNLFSLILWSSVAIIDPDIKKAPESFKELCRKAMKQKTPQERKQIIKKYMKSTIEAECTRIIIDEAVDSNEEKIKIIADVFEELNATTDTPTMQENTPTIQEDTLTKQCPNGKKYKQLDETPF